MADFKVIYSVFLMSMVYGAWCVPHHTADHSNHCHAQGESELIHIEVGESATLPGKCEKVECLKDFSLATTPCPSLHADATGCKLSDIDTKKPYPECCPQVICDSKH